MFRETAGATFTRPEVKPVAPAEKYDGAYGSARPATHTNRSSPASRAKDANRAASGTAYFTPTTFGQASASSASREPASAGLRMYGTTPNSGTDSATARW